MAVQAVQALQAENEHVEEKFRKVSGVLEKERTALREVLANCKTKIQQLETEKADTQRRLQDALDEIERLKRLLREAQSQGGDVSHYEGSIRTLQNGLRLLVTHYTDSDLIPTAGDGFRGEWSSFKTECASMHGGVFDCGRAAVDVENVMDALLSRAETAEKRLADAQRALDEQRKKFMAELLEAKQQPTSPRMSPRSGEAALHKVSISGF